uniref:Uncharacterized protein n=1 Tax=Romanomermis culicivorax TaxID=13658 RepID=A0A915IBG0_ROMCU
MDKSYSATVGLGGGGGKNKTASAQLLRDATGAAKLGVEENRFSYDEDCRGWTSADGDISMEVTCCCLFVYYIFVYFNN